MGPDLELKGRSEILMEGLTTKKDGSLVKVPEEKQLICASNYEDKTYEMEASLDKQIAAHIGQDVDANIVECINSGDSALIKAERYDATENSTSFDNSLSGVENGVILGDNEVVSELQGDAALSFDSFGDFYRMRKKRLTSHWRTFIKPLTWRCKWIELQIKKLQLHARKYDSQLLVNKQRKQSKLENFVFEGFCSKSLPYSSDSKRERAMKRKKRKRIEDTMDTAAYMSHHNLFSYYEYKRSTADGAFVNNDWHNLVSPKHEKINGSDEFGHPEEEVSLEFQDGHSSLEQILRKIGVVQTQVGHLKARLNKVMREQSGMFPSTDKSGLFVPCNALTSSAQNPASPPNNGDRMPVRSSYIASQLLREYNMGDPIIPESAISSHDDVTHLSDIIERADQNQVGNSRRYAGEGILIYSRRAKEELNNFEARIQPTGRHHTLKLEQESSTLPAPAVEDLPLDDQPRPKIRSISKLTAPKKTRKRSRRKAGRGN